MYVRAVINKVNNNNTFEVVRTLDDNDRIVFKTHAYFVFNDMHAVQIPFTHVCVLSRNSDALGNNTGGRIVNAFSTRKFVKIFNYNISSVTRIDEKAVIDFNYKRPVARVIA